MRTATIGYEFENRGLPHIFGFRLIGRRVSRPGRRRW